MDLSNRVWLVSQQFFFFILYFFFLLEANITLTYHKNFEKFDDFFGKKKNLKVLDSF